MNTRKISSFLKKSNHQIKISCLSNEVSSAEDPEYQNIQRYEMCRNFQYRSLKKTEVSTLFPWIKQVRCWEHSDDLSKIFAQALEENPQWVLPRLKKWNKSKNPWERRQSVVSLIEYHGKREKVLPFKELISFIHPLLADEDYYVQKGVGWTLREIYCIYPKQTMKFFEKHLNAIQATAYSASVEKLDKKTKADFRQQRKKYRESLRKK